MIRHSWSGLVDSALMTVSYRTLTSVSCIDIYVSHFTELYFCCLYVINLQGRQIKILSLSL